MSRPITKTATADLVREIRREADAVKNIIDGVSKHAREHGLTIPEMLERMPQTSQALTERLNIIDGDSALLRERLGLEA